MKAQNPEKMRNSNLYRSYLLLSFILCIGMAQAQKKYKLTPAQMSGHKVHMLSGEVKKVTYTNGDFIEFDTYGNVTRIQLEGDKAEYTYENDKRYKYYNEFYNILFTDNMRIEKWDNELENISTNYTFDAQGRLLKKEKAGMGDHVELTYEYEGNKTQPVKSTYTSGWESGYVNTTISYTYTNTDNNGNWLSCKADITEEIHEEDKETQIKKQTKNYTRTITYYTNEELAQGESYQQASTNKTSGSGASWSKEKTKELLVQILVGLLFLAAIGHMIYINFIRGKRYRIIYTPEYFQEQRKNNNLSETASAEEDAQAWELLNEAFNTWPVVKSYSEEEQEFRKPRRMKQINASAALIDQAIALAPTDQDTVNRINELIEVVNSNEERYFNGSKLLIGVAVGVTVLMGYMNGMAGVLPFALAIILYLLASRTPVFLLEKRAESRMGSVSNGIFAGIFAMIAGASTIRTTTEWSDGSKTVEDDHSQHWIAWVLGLVVIFLLGAFIAIWAIFNYLRNYILYI